MKPADANFDANAESTVASGARARRRRWLFGLLALGVVTVVAMIVVAVHWSRQPAVFDVAAVRAQRLAPTGGSPVAGTALVATAIEVGDTLLGKPGGLLFNDRLPPGVVMDNMPSFECGLIMALRDLLQALRNDFTRAQSQSRENLDVKRADLQFAIDPDFWLMPAAEDEYRDGVAALERYLAQLGAEQTTATEGFFPRADNLAAYLALVEKRLGNFGARLSGSVADAGLSRMLGSEKAPVAAATPSAEIDNVFYCARGYGWVLLHVMRAIEIDFASVLESKNARETLATITQDLEGAIKALRSPMVLNGHGYGLVANHSLVIASYLSRVNAAVIELRLLLARG